MDLLDAPQIIRFSHRLMETYILSGVAQIHADNILATFDNKDGIYPEPLFKKAERYRGCLFAFAAIPCSLLEYNGNPAKRGRSIAEISPCGAAGMKGKVNRTTCLGGVLTKSEAHQSEGGLTRQRSVAV